MIEQADRLSMPLLFSHATGDETIPVEQSRRLQERLANAPNVRYVEIEGGGHDSPLHGSGMLDWLDESVRR